MAQHGEHYCIGSVLSVYEVIDADEVVVLACRHVRQDEVNWSLAHDDK